MWLRTKNGDCFVNLAFISCILKQDDGTWKLWENGDSGGYPIDEETAARLFSFLKKNDLVL